MMLPSREQVEEILERIYSVDSKTRVSLLDDAVRMADEIGDLDLSYETRMSLVSAAMDCGQSDKVLVAFAWCLAKYDAHPERFDQHSLYWEYKAVLQRVATFPDISKAQVLQVVEDISRRYTQAGISLRPVHRWGLWVAEMLGDPQLKRTHFNQFLVAKRDGYADCEACETDSIVDYYALAHEDEKAVQAAKKILAGKLRCNGVPRQTYARLLFPFLRLGQYEKAAEMYTKGYPLIRSNPQGAIEKIGWHLAFLAITQNFTPAIQELGRMIPFALDSTDCGDQLSFFKDAQLLLLCLQEIGKQEKIFLPIPSHVPFYQSNGVYSTSTLFDWFSQQASQLAQAFDRRNGNYYFTEGLKQGLDRIQLSRPITLSPEQPSTLK